MAAHGHEAVAISAITASELLHGVYRADSPERRTWRRGASRWATALAVGFSVATHDERSFPLIPGLVVERW